MASRPGLTKDTVVRTAGEMADDVGLWNLTFSALASRLGVRTPSLYNHVDGLDALHRELALAGVQELEQRLGRAALGKAGDEALGAMLHAYRSFAKERPGLYQATVRAPGDSDEELQVAAKSIVDTVLTVLEPFRLSEQDAIHVVRGFRAIAHGFTALETAGAFGIPVNTDESYQRLVSTFLSGLNG